jgi:hypothetical protein
MIYRLWVGSLPTVAFWGRVLIEVPRGSPSKKYYFDANVNYIILIFFITQPELFSYKLGLARQACVQDYPHKTPSDKLPNYKHLL